MEMQKYMSLLLVCALGVLASLEFGCGSIVGDYLHRSCIESEKQALLLFKKTLIDDSNHLSSWVGDDCCAWRGIGCNNITNHVTQLELQSGGLSGLVSHHLGNLSNLQYLDLSYYDSQLRMDSMWWLSKLSLLEHLYLSGVNLSSAIDWFSSINMLSKSILVLDLSNCHLPNNIPRPLPLMNLTSLVSFHLSDNQLNSSFPSWVLNNTKLAHLSLGLNNFHGPIPETFCQLSKLEMLDVEHNRLTGNIPKCIGKLSNLSALMLSDNSWEGFVTEHHFINLRKLVSFSISSDSKLNLNISSEWVPSFQLGVLYMYSFKVGPKFPHWLLTQRNIGTLVLSNTSISDTIPIDWFLSLFSSSFSFVDLSNNDIYGEQLSQISRAPNGLVVLILSDNRLSGEFPAFLCNQTSLVTLALSNNNFSGELPRCLEYLTQLRVLDLMNNGLSGKLPSLGSLGSLQYLNLYNNKFQGKLPLSSQNLTQLFLLDVGKNNLSDVLPPWTGEQSPLLKYLVLRSNNFYGEIPTQLCQHSAIEVLNLADNQITGSIPSCFGNFSAMVIGNITPNILYTWGEVEMMDETKGYEQPYTSTLMYLFSIDLSNNNISGEIPEELMDLHGLLNLNLAGNHLAGKIPNEIGKLKNLIFLDLSRNELHGPIPHSLSYLNFLSQLNLSFNDLSGRIPSGNQLQTLDDPSIYAGNDLCGHPILKPCAGDIDSHNVNDHNQADTDFDSDDEHMWFFAGLGPGFSVGLLGFYVALRYSN